MSKRAFVNDDDPITAQLGENILRLGDGDNFGDEAKAVCVVFPHAHEVLRAKDECFQGSRRVLKHAGQRGGHECFSKSDYVAEDAAAWLLQVPRRDIWAKAKIELGVERMPEMQLHHDLAGLELRRESALTRLILIGGCANRKLRTEFLRQAALQADHGLIAHLVLVRQETVGFAQFLLWQPLHPDDEAALMAGSACPLFHQRINGLPSAKIEAAHAEVGALGDFQRAPQRRQKIGLDIIKYAGHGGSCC